MEDLICFGIGSIISWALTSAIWSKRKKRCASTSAVIIDAGLIAGSAHSRCPADADRRCVGGNCTIHCKHGCAGKCLE